MTKQSFLRGTMILLGAGIINRLLGFIPRITLPRMIGAEGVGLYQMGWPFLIMLITFITGGIPLAVAKLVAEAEASHQSKRIAMIMKISLIITCLLSCIGILLCVYGSTWIAQHLLTDPRASITISYMSSMLIFIGISSVLRGYFQGKMNMTPTAFSQMTETIVRIIMVLVCASLLLPKGIAYAAGGAMLGVALGELAGMCVLIGLYFNSKSNRKNSHFLHVPYVKMSTFSYFQEFKRLYSISIPVTGSKLIGASSFMFESILITQSLAIAGIATSIATAQFGALQGMIIPILLLPSALTSSLSISLIPSLSDAVARGDDLMIRYRLQQSLRLALTTGALCSMLMYVLADPICLFLYHSTEASAMLKLMAPVAVFMYLQSPMQAALQALNQSTIALVNTLIGSIIKLALIYGLASQPQFGIFGAIIAMNVSILITTGLQGFHLFRLYKINLDVTYLLKILLCLGITAILVFLVYEKPWVSSTFIRFGSAMCVGLFCYVGLLVWTAIISREKLTRIGNWWKSIKK